MIESVWGLIGIMYWHIHDSTLNEDSSLRNVHFRKWGNRWFAHINCWIEHSQNCVKVWSIQKLPVLPNKWWPLRVKPLQKYQWNTDWSLRTLFEHCALIIQQTNTKHGTLKAKHGSSEVRTTRRSLNWPTMAINQLKIKKDRLPAHKDVICSVISAELCVCSSLFDIYFSFFVRQINE